MSASVANELTGLRVVHYDGTATPVEVRRIGCEPREVYGEPVVVSVWEVTMVVPWEDGDRWEWDTRPDYFIIRSTRVHA